MLNNISIPFDRENPFECRKSPVWQYSLDELHITANNKVQSAVCGKASKKPHIERLEVLAHGPIQVAFDRNLRSTYPKGASSD